MDPELEEKIKKLDLTDKEKSCLNKCLKSDIFLAVFKDCKVTEGIKDPENKKKDEGIAMQEREMEENNVKFVHPSPGHVLKTSHDGQQKCFINICSSPQIGKPVSMPTVTGSSRVMQWSIPHGLSQPREDIDKAGVKCIVYDVVFSPDTYHMSQKNAKFQKMIHNMALDAVERLFHVTLDKVGVKRPKMTFKGLPQTSILSTLSEDTRELDVKGCGDADNLLRFPHPPLSNDEVNEDANAIKASRQNSPSKEATISNSDEAPVFVEPNYILTQRGYFDMKDYYTDPDYKEASARPRELILNIELPMLKSLSALHLEIFQERVFLECAKPVHYRLDLKLPYPIHDSKGHSNFNQSRRKLTLTLEVSPPKLQQTLKLPKIVQQKSDDTCGCCGREEEVNIQKIREDTGEVYPSQNIFLPSDHPSGLLHGLSKCRHQNHGALWGKDYEEASTNHNKLGFLHNVSPFLVEKLAGRLSSRTEKEFFGKTCPPIFYHQDETFVTIIVNVKHIDIQKLWYVICPDNLQFSCISKNYKHDLIHQLYIEFDDGEIIDPRRSRVDVSVDNAVFLFRKHITSEHEWQIFNSGFDSLTLQKLSFATESNVNNLISSVKKQAQKGVTREFACVDVSSAKNSELVALKLVPKEVVDEIRLLDKEKEKTIVIELPILEKILGQICGIQGKLGRDANIDHEEVFIQAMNIRDQQIPETADS